jgi:Transposase and inactivated derivatives
MWILRSDYIECSRNIKVMWLLRGLTPNLNTISNFRRENGNDKAIRNVFRAIVHLAQNFDLIGGKLLSGYGTKL